MRSPGYPSHVLIFDGIVKLVGYPGRCDNQDILAADIANGLDIQGS